MRDDGVTVGFVGLSETKIAGYGIPAKLSTIVRSAANVDNEAVLAAALAGVLKPSTLHATFLFVVAVAVLRVMVREELT